MALTCRECEYPGNYCICGIEAKVEEKPMMNCGWCGCEMEDAEPYCKDCVEALNASMELQLEGEETDDTPREEETVCTHLDYSY